MKSIAVLLMLTLCLSLCLGLSACGGSGSGDGNAAVDGSASADESAAEEQGDEDHGHDSVDFKYGVETFESAAVNEDLFITVIKNASPQDYPEVTVGDAFDWYFEDPQWRAFEGTRDGDDETYYVVEFRGGCVYLGKEREALIQFTFSPDFGSFEATYFALDGESMSFNDLNELMEVAYYGYSADK